MSIRSKRTDKRHQKSKKWREFWFSVFKLKRMRKAIRKAYYKALDMAPSLNELTIYAHAFKRLSKKQIEFGLELFVKRRELISYEYLKKADKDAYKLKIPDIENDFSTLEEIDLSDVVAIENQTQNRPFD